MLSHNSNLVVVSPYRHGKNDNWSIFGIWMALGWDIVTEQEIPPFKLLARVECLTKQNQGFQKRKTF